MQPPKQRQTAAEIKHQPRGRSQLDSSTAGGDDHLRMGIPEPRRKYGSKYGGRRRAPRAEFRGTLSRIPAQAPETPFRICVRIRGLLLVITPVINRAR